MLHGGRRQHAHCVPNSDHSVASTTRARVSAAIRDLDFRPDTMAQSLRAGTDTAVGLVVESIADPFFATVIDTAEAEMARDGRSVLVASTQRDHDQERAVIRRMVHWRVAGLVVAPTGQDTDWLHTPTTPIVLVDRGVPGVVADLIDIDDRQAAFDAVSHLTGAGQSAPGKAR